MNGKIIYSMRGSGKGRTVVAKRATVRDRTLLHWHDCYEIELVASGFGTHIINGKPYPMRAGDFYLLTPEDYHQVISNEPIVTLGIMFDERLVSEELLFNIPVIRIASPELITDIDGELYDKVKDYFERVLAEERTPTENYLSSVYISRLIECIIIELFRSISGNATAVTHKTVNDALIYLHGHYAENITLASLADELHLSPAYLSAYFKESVGKNFKEYLIDLRMKHAARLLANTELSVTEICFSCGFSSYSHFIRTFGERFGETPLRFRKIHKSKK